MKTILITGKSFSGLTSYLLEHGYDFVVLRDQKTTKFPDKKFKKRLVVDFSDSERMLEALKLLKRKPAAVITVYENYILPAAMIAKKLGLYGLPIKSAEACTDKYIMRSMFAEAPEKISPEFAEVDSEQTLRKFANCHTFPLILKPANLVKSLLVTKSMNMDELLENYQKSSSLIQETYAKYAPERKPKMIVEEYLEGSVHSVDAFIDRAGEPHILSQIVDYQTGYDIGFDDNFHYSRILPTKLPPEKQKDLLHCAKLGVEALGMKNSPAHIEIIMTKNGARIVEIGARNGGYRERMHWLANGIKLTKNALQIAMGEQPDIAATKNEPVAVLELFPKNAGFFVGIKNEAKLRTLKSLNYLSIKAKKGNFIGKSSDGYKMAAVVILHNSDSAQFQKDLDFVSSEVEVVTT
ncbi:MAG: ATP-grasp domain-containing protein [Candidatus Nomurabacteria bacterium]|jgi:biotin carboxylase|nr:ATP-grasp domain-containing protein [Candidatus Nomurabacteria bacterium]